jgi:hypothetical protein
MTTTIIMIQRTKRANTTPIINGTELVLEESVAVRCSTTEMQVTVSSSGEEMNQRTYYLSKRFLPSTLSVAVADCNLKTQETFVRLMKNGSKVS